MRSTLRSIWAKLPLHGILLLYKRLEHEPFVRETTALLLDVGADTSLRDMYGRALVHWAAERRVSAPLTLLLEHHLKACKKAQGRIDDQGIVLPMSSLLDLRDDQGQTPEEVALSAGLHRGVEIIRHFRTAG
jgi:ankyrin repeat protein